MVHRNAVAVLARTRFGGGQMKQERTVRDSRARLAAVRAIVWLCRRVALAALRTLSVDQPARVLHESWIVELHARSSSLPYGGFIPRGRAPLSRTAKLLWATVAFLLLSDLLPIMPVDLGLIPDVHLLHLLIGGHPSQDVANRLYDGMTSQPHLFGIRLPWADLY